MFSPEFIGLCVDGLLLAFLSEGLSAGVTVPVGLQQTVQSSALGMDPLVMLMMRKILFYNGQFPNLETTGLTP